MEEDILPQVEKLKRDRSNFLEYQKIGRELEALQRKLIAFDFMSSLVSIDCIYWQEKIQSFLKKLNFK